MADTPIKSAAGEQPPPPAPKGLDGKQLQATVKPGDSPVKDQDERIILQDSPQPAAEPGPETKKVMSLEERAQRKARLAVLLDRGIVSDRLTVELPPEIHGEWNRNDPLEIQRLRTLGFEVDTKYAPARALHNDGTGSAVVGDVVFMITSRENKELIDEIRHEQFSASNSPRKAREEKQFEEKTGKDTGGQIPTFTDSTQKSVRKEEILAALNEVDQQTKPVLSR